jgi:ribonuclease PH
MTPASPRTGRAPDELRPVTLERHASPYAEGSCLISTGETRVLCTATVEDYVPDWRKGRGLGWVTAEYAMLPRSTQRRTGRERVRVGGRTQEIQRLIGRALRATMDMASLGERTILIDCDVIVADGGTRTAAITGAAVALHDACTWLVNQGAVDRTAMSQLVAATSVGIVDGAVRLDLEYTEDVRADVDMNLVALEAGDFVEVQGTGEQGSFSRDQLDTLLDTGTRGIHELLRLQRATLGID